MILNFVRFFVKLLLLLFSIGCDCISWENKGQKEDIEGAGWFGLDKHKFLGKIY